MIMPKYSPSLCIFRVIKILLKEEKSSPQTLRFGVCWTRGLFPPGHQQEVHTGPGQGLPGLWPGPLLADCSGDRPMADMTWATFSLLKRHYGRVTSKANASKTFGTICTRGNRGRAGPPMSPGSSCLPESPICLGTPADPSPRSLPEIGCRDTTRVRLMCAMHRFDRRCQLPTTQPRPLAHVRVCWSNTQALC